MSTACASTVPPTFIPSLDPAAKTCLNAGAYSNGSTARSPTNTPGGSRDWQGYSENIEGYRSTDAATERGEYDGFPFRAALSIGPYSVLIFSQ